ncbi:MAG: FadR/GntR family transcriptional regulator [Winkia neuii]|uniref:FadR family transcriptional regulator n=1 Tax=Winkia neuii TaxID=33007 RepID=A0A2I1IQ76_9ACTO|nr:FadR/GntR family transcriptional regulator [Winkia neuii]OFJ72277.1 hypothetical protein HMPREF2851_04955 [Actinomyces sp. HMSC064C12]OFK01992.1 hypothetical protein HMPREF2835_08190 [Actinomyces sp. HMSC072A03]OFT54512.1 hypothetical protein HMPREF3152_08525 [Actinomyces sp. HMSC06A08]MDK8098777.1 FadR/GntR family transcriptional regulator [Winkia neuii]MDU3134087.1 FadR/GntR family transcriptional regulator [Winkia neuii]
MKKTSDILSSLPPTLTGYEKTKLEQKFASRADSTVEAVEQYIISEHLNPGDPLPTEAELCKLLGVSRSSVREAMRQLQALDIVATKQGKGAFVSNMSLSPLVNTLVLRSSMGNGSLGTLDEVVAMRKYLDIGVGHELVEKRDQTDPEKIEELQDLVKQMISKSATGHSYIQEDIAFHRGLISILQNQLLDEMMSAMWLIHMAVVPSLPADPAGLILTAKAHGAMLKAVEDGDIHAYYCAVEDHYEPLKARMNAAQ